MMGTGRRRTRRKEGALRARANSPKAGLKECWATPPTLGFEPSSQANSPTSVFKVKPSGRCALRRHAGLHRTLRRPSTCG